MKMFKFFGLVVFLLTAVLLGCLQSRESAPSTTPVSSTSDTSTGTLVPASYQNIRQTFAIHWFQIAAGEKPENNLVVSPLGTSLMLDSLILGSQGKTKSELELACSASGFQENWYDNAITTMQSLSNTEELQVTSSMWIQKSFKINPTYIDSLLKLTNQNIQSIDFAKQGAEKQINEWIEKESHGKIVNLLDSVSPESRLMLINTVAFSGKWKYAFNPEETRKGYFTDLAGKEVRVPMMQQEHKFKYFKDENLQLLELPYKEDRFSMVIVLPEREKKYADMLRILSAEKLYQWRKNAAETLVDVRLPKFTLDNKVNLISSLKTMGIQDAFSDTADFSKITDGKELMVSHMTQGVWIQVDEKGTEAAAATESTFTLKSAAPTKNPTFYADRPFLYFIIENKTDSILFMGQIVNPDILAKIAKDNENNFTNVSIESTGDSKVPDGKVVKKKISNSIFNSGEGGIME